MCDAFENTATTTTTGKSSETIPLNQFELPLYFSVSLPAGAAHPTFLRIDYSRFMNVKTGGGERSSQRRI